MYVPTNWKDEVVEHPNRYRETSNADGSIEHVPDPGEVLQEGTPQSAVNFNHMEAGIFEAHQICAENTRMLNSERRKVAGIVGETLQVTLSNTQSYPFNNSLKTVQLTTPRNTKDYTITPEIVSASGGAIGDIEFSDKLLNGFKVAFTGSAKTVVLNLYVRGGM
ncbi:MAG: hypothetical protein Q4C77_04010 [Eubacteriales bacterium]|nr:hypothetical protein [Eubacteriales bacterium]